MVENLPPESERPFSAEERWRLREFLKTTEGMRSEDFIELRKVAQGGRLVRSASIVLGRIFIMISGLVGFWIAFKQLFSMKGG
jgi:hypothetical protein